MARKTFISYKYSEAQQLRDTIITALGEDATYYQGETSDSPDLTDSSTESIKGKLTDMMYDTSVTIVIVSPNFTASKWIDWEIEYCLKEISRKGRTSKTNGVVGVVQKMAGAYDWLVTTSRKPDGCIVRTINNSKLYPIINNNRYKRRNQGYACANCKSHSQLEGSYISLIDESDFLADLDKYIDNAYQKAERYDEFNLTKQR
ncbi:MAG: TIR domain-containing protein [Deltaproteobacteria bacterium]|nr:TIR domain-containing protein [Deltaproteobacteria bacterium]